MLLTYFLADFQTHSILSDVIIPPTLSQYNFDLAIPNLYLGT